MGFTAPWLSLTGFAWKFFPSVTGQTPVAPAANNDSGPDCTVSAGSGSALLETYPNVLTMRKSRTRSRNTAVRSGKASTAPIQLTLPLPANDCAQPRLLKIVQREPQKQPECLLISGRMADVCAALERMARTEQALHS